MGLSVDRFDRWQDFEEAVTRRTAEFKELWHSPSAVPFFRGHQSTEYDLRPSLLRPVRGRWYTPADEQNLFYEFRSRGGALLPAGLDSWDVLFSMRHYGLPTRLLDWSESFAAALFFALNGSEKAADIVVWFLDPYTFNKATCEIAEVLDVRSDLKHSYLDYFVEPKPDAAPEWKHAVAIYPERRLPRLSGQLATFTLHVTCAPLEKLSLPGLTRLALSGRARVDAEAYLQLAGINDQSLFADLDGLARLLCRRFPPQNDCTWHEA